MVRPYPYVVAIIQARLGSQRFPRKMLADLHGWPVLRWSIERLKRCKRVHEIVVASPDKELTELAYDAGVRGFQYLEDENNVLARYLKCAHWCDAEVVVRITGDCPLIDPELVDNTIKGFVENRVDISTNVFQRTYARGFDCEVTHVNVLKRIFHLTIDRRYREHVTLFAYEHPELFVFHNESDISDNHEFNVSVDSKEDLDSVNKIIHHLNVSPYCTWREITEVMRLGRDGLLPASFDGGSPGVDSKTDESSPGGTVVSV